MKRKTLKNSQKKNKPEEAKSSQTKLNSNDLKSYFTNIDISDSNSLIIDLDVSYESEEDLTKQFTPKIPTKSPSKIFKRKKISSPRIVKQSSIKITNPEEPSEPIVKEKTDLQSLKRQTSYAPKRLRKPNLMAPKLNQKAQNQDVSSNIEQKDQNLASITPQNTKMPTAKSLKPKKRPLRRKNPSKPTMARTSSENVVLSRNNKASLMSSDVSNSEIKPLQNTPDNNKSPLIQVQNKRRKYTSRVKKPKITV